MLRGGLVRYGGWDRGERVGVDWLVEGIDQASPGASCREGSEADNVHLIVIF